MSRVRGIRFTTRLILAAVLLLAVSGALIAQGGGPARIGASVDGPFSNGVIPDDLPPVPKGPMTVGEGQTEGTSVLSFDDGTCEGGLGVGAATFLQFLVDFDVPTVCTTSGLSVRGVSARMNTVTTSGVVASFVLHNQTASPNPTATGPDATVPIAPLVSQGPCPAPASFQTRSVATGLAVVDNTIGFFAGIGGGGGFAGRDTNSPQGRIWLQCPLCGMTTYNPTDIAGLGFNGNWNIRVTVEDANCVPVELMGFGIE